jgi:RES domain-containing protein
LLERLAHLSIHPTEDQSRTVAARLAIPTYLITPEHVRNVTANELQELDPNWRDPGNETCAKLGELWYSDGAHLMLRVPSALIPQEYNTVVNCSHAFVSELIAFSEFAVSDISLDKRIVEILDIAAIRERNK